MIVQNQSPMTWWCSYRIYLCVIPLTQSPITSSWESGIEFQLNFPKVDILSNLADWVESICYCRGMFVHCMHSMLSPVCIFHMGVLGKHLSSLNFQNSHLFLPANYGLAFCFLRVITGIAFKCLMLTNCVHWDTFCVCASPQVMSHRADSAFVLVVNICFCEVAVHILCVQRI